MKNDIHTKRLIKCSNFFYMLFNFSSIIYLIYSSDFSLAHFDMANPLEKALTLGIMLSIFLLPIILLANLMVFDNKSKKKTSSS
ncbi:hypothetical protein BV494_17135 [Rahnella sikkimica]|uniref:Uncharacterized protein n=1 Tax=Rahnella sikkimica TaxID=1805933 RepID=A0A2L1UUB7_9GAMM|nr:hypothetical protein BV494_17135 [Rahnella sikkimica]